MMERIMVEKYPLCGAKLRAVEVRAVRLVINSMAFEPKTGHLDFTGKPKEYEVIDCDIESRDIYCENRHEEDEIRKGLESGLVP
ncbi:MAG: hypothetical protein ACRDKA_03350 [Actinomycetota bacterium]